MNTHCLTHTTGPGWSASAAAITSALGLALLGCAADSTGGEPGTQPASVAASEGEVPPWSGHRIAFTRSRTGDDSVLWTARSDGSHQRKVFKGPVYFPAWVPNQSRLVFDFPDDEGGEQIATIRANGSHFRQLTDLPGISESPDYAPGGQRIIFGRFSPISRPSTRRCG